MEEKAAYPHLLKMKHPKPQLTEPEVEEIRSVFNLFAGEGTGLLNTSELKEAMKSLGFERNNPKIYDMIVKLDEKQGSKGLTFEEFLESLIAPQWDTSSKEGINKLFDLFVQNQGDVITSKHVEAAAKELGEEFNSKEIEELIKSAAANGHGITREEFYNIMSKQAFV